MYRRFRLSTHRKNEFRKHTVVKSRCVVITETLRVEQASQQHNLSQSLPGDDTKMQLVVSIPQESVSVMGVSLDLDLYLQSPVGTTELLRSRLSRLSSSLPQGETLYQPLSFYLPHPYPYCKSYILSLRAVCRVDRDN